MERHDDNSLIIYTDGSTRPNPRRGESAFRLLHVDQSGLDSTPIDHNPAGYLGATSNQMELMACVEALKLVTGRRSPVPRDSFGKIVIYTGCAASDAIGTGRAPLEISHA